MKQIVPTFKLGEELNKKYIEQTQKKTNQEIDKQTEKTDLTETLLEKGKKVIMINNNKDKEEVSA
jgi:hypothetical protein